MAQTEEFLDSLRTQVSPETGPTDFSTSVFEYAAKSRHNKRAYSAEELEARLIAGEQRKSARKYWWGAGFAFASALFAAVVLLLPGGKERCLMNAGAIVAPADSAFNCEQHGQALKIVLGRGRYSLEFAENWRKKEERIIAFETSRLLIKITGTKLAIDVDEAQPAKIDVRLETGKIKLELGGQTRDLAPGESVAVRGDKLPATEKPASLTRFHLYNGRIVTGEILTRGEIYRIRTRSGIVAVPLREIKKETPL